MNAEKEIAEMRRLLQIEYEADKHEFELSADRIGLRRLAERGLAWTDLKIGSVYYNSLNQRTVEVTRTSDTDINHHFEYGRPVSFFTVGGDPGLKPKIAFSATVNYVDSERMTAVIRESDNVDLLREGTAGVMLAFDETTYRIMFATLDELAKAKGRLAELRDLVYSHRSVGTRPEIPPGLPYLNAAQQQAVAKVLAAKDVAIVHGPPGTGKTTTLVEAIYATLRRETQVLVCAQSNMAVDCICEKLVERGLNVVRLGNPIRVNDRMLESTLERRFEAHPDYPKLWAIRRELRQMKGSRHSNRDKRLKLREEAQALEIQITDDIFTQARVVACTLTGSAHKSLLRRHFGTVFIDEAAQALEAASWIPGRLADRMVFAGDHCQLPPTVKSYEAQKQGLDRSLMERIVANHPEAVSLLTMQYRMNEEIMRFSSDWFYGGMMTAAPEVACRGILDYDSPIEWIDTAGLTEGETTGGAGHGRLNMQEAELTADALEAYISRIGGRRFLEERIDIGVISPYQAQTVALRRLIRSRAYFKPFRKSITVDTVDGFQGRERDVIVISMVRSNDEGNIGFLRELRRMNVAMTRARMKLIIIGDSTTLTRHPFYRKLHSMLDA